MKRVICTLLLILSFASPIIHARTTSRGTQRRSNAAAAGSYDATALSMVIWGTGLAVIITTAAILIPNDTSASSGSSGSSSHSHS